MRNRIFIRSILALSFILTTALGALAGSLAVKEAVR